MATPTTDITADLQTEAAATIRALILEKSPTADVGLGSAIDSLVIQNQALPYANAGLEIQTLQKLLGLVSVTEGTVTLTSEEVDALAANYFITRKPAVKASGKITCVFASQSVVTLTPGFLLQASAGGVNAVFGPAVSFTGYPSTTAGVVASSTAGFFRARSDGYYELDVPVVQTDDSVEVTGYAITVSQGQVFAVASSVPGFRSATATSTFVGGTAEESDTDLIARVKLGPVPKIVNSRTQIQAYLSDTVPSQNVGIFGGGHPLMTRDKANVLGLSTGGRTDVYVKPPEAIGSGAVQITDTLRTQTVLTDSAQYSFDVSATPTIKARSLLSSSSTTYVAGQVVDVANNIAEITLNAGIGIGALRVKSINRAIRYRDTFATQTTVVGSSGTISALSGQTNVSGYIQNAEGGVASLQNVLANTSLVYAGMTDKTTAIAAADYYGALAGTRKLRITDPNKDISRATVVGSWSSLGGGSYTYNLAQTSALYTPVLGDLYAYSDILLLGYPSAIHQTDATAAAIMELYDEGLRSPGSDILVKLAVPCEVGVVITISGQNAAVNYGTSDSPQYNAPLSWLTAIATAISSVGLGNDRLGFDQIVRSLTPYLTTGTIRDLAVSGTIRGPAGDIILPSSTYITIPDHSNTLKLSPANVGFVCATTAIQVNFV